ncbi:hypothetical protein FOG51_03476 [Hanseniaspora uvarum]|jgi:serine/threonine-protein phosphatase 4 catalytic subunit|uniref:Serine/threonine-protein phosphatase n=1 Tax=Hanseniaspora uvarum TaxID=29833 RepID=A0A1E5R767_HANUV|nr:hypothetical protein FOG48_02425 [Hanseniaspora uvarum]KAF0272095.1 hypothetical protein FOG51_03476 [Hanseniaspora uvarum]OEJ82752.1 Serine/threonine-protein phosphatase 4 catalytic subunit [Hanseniaspora uvarum]GMM42058.1 hypothetical protein DAHU10_029680 [Hanseniaspora uvarum]
MIFDIDYSIQLILNNSFSNSNDNNTLQKTDILKYFTPDIIHQICEDCIDIFINENNIVDIEAPVTVCGDIHGQLHDLLNILNITYQDYSIKTLFEQINNTKYLFLGDFVDRGFYSFETILFLILLKLKYPDRIYLIRGNHESSNITKIYGFYDEIINKFGTSTPYLNITNLFNHLPISATINTSNKDPYFAMHGGISPDLLTLNDFDAIDRIQEPPHKGPMCDLLWSDPEDNINSDYKVSPRGAGYLFSKRPLKEFNYTNGLSMVLRAHQLVMEGFKMMFDDELCTVWSAANYCYRCGNLGSTLNIDSSGNYEFSLFEGVDINGTDKLILPVKKLSNSNEYFL